MEDGVKPRRPWDEGQSILEAVRTWEAVRPRYVGHPIFDGAGAFRSISGLSTRDADVVADHLTSLFGDLADHPTDDALEALFAELIAVRKTYPPDLVDRVVAAVAELDDRAALAEPMRKLITVARYGVQMRFAIAVLGITGRPADVPLIQAAGHHFRFTRIALDAIMRLVPEREAVDTLWAFAKSTHEWARVPVVKRLAALDGLRPDVQRWLLYEGCKTTPDMDQPANACATAGNLVGALAGPVDDELLDAAYRLFDSFLDIGPPENELQHYRDGAVAAERYLARQPAPAEIPFNTCVLIWKLERWTGEARDLIRGGPDEAPSSDNRNRNRRRHEDLTASGWTETACERILRACAEILEDPTVVDQVRSQYFGPDGDASSEAWAMAPRVGLDLWEIGFQQLQDGSRRGMFHKLLVGASTERRQRVLEWAEDLVWLEEDESGPASIPAGRPEPHFKLRGRDIGKLGPLFTAMADGDVYSARFVAVVLKTSKPDYALRALKALTSHPRSRWGPDVTAQVERLASSPDKLTSEPARALLSGELTRGVHGT